MNNQWMPHINRNICTGCAECIIVCPTAALAQIDGKAALVHPDLCIYCADCEEHCPVGAIELPYLICKAES